MDTVVDSKSDPDRESFGRRFTSSDFRLIRELARDFSALSLTELAGTLCELLDWKRPNGKLKHKECRAVLEQLQTEGLVSLPALRKTAPLRPRKIVVRGESDAKAPLTGTAGDYTPLWLEPVEGIELSSLWNQFIDRYHYLRCRVPFGANLRYLVRSERKPGEYLACLLFSSPAWKMAPRDAWIGWNDEQRKRNLQYVVSNGRFLVLPWISVRGLASKILSLAARQLPEDVGGGEEVGRIGGPDGSKPPLQSSAEWHPGSLEVDPFPRGTKFPKHVGLMRLLQGRHILCPFEAKQMYSEMAAEGAP